MSRKIIQFPATEAEMVQGLKILLKDPSIHVGVEKAKAGQDSPTTQIIVRSDGGGTQGVVFRNERFGINIWHYGSFKEATLLGERILALLTALPAVSSTFKEISIESGLIRLAEDSEEEHRYITLSALVQGFTTQI